MMYPNKLAEAALRQVNYTLKQENRRAPMSIKQLGSQVFLGRCKPTYTSIEQKGFW